MLSEETYRVNWARKMYTKTQQNETSLVVSLTQDHNKQNGTLNPSLSPTSLAGPSASVRELTGGELVR